MTTFTVITSTLNALHLLKYTAASIFGQSLHDWQWIIIDGASTDGTSEWLRETCIAYQNCFYISELDQGIFDAWNKALPLVLGDWVIFLGSGDQFRHRKILEICAELLAATPAAMNLAYGRSEFTDRADANCGKLIDNRWEGLTGTWEYGRPRLPSHQSVFHRARMFNNGSGFDASYRIAGDAAVLLREFLRNGGVDIQLTTSLVVGGGISDKRSNKPLMLRENLRANRSVGLFWTRAYYQYAALIYHYLRAFLSSVGTKELRRQSSEKEVHCDYQQGR